MENEFTKAAPAPDANTGNILEDIARELGEELAKDQHQETQEESKAKVLSLKYSKTGRADQPQELHFDYSKAEVITQELTELAKEDPCFGSILLRASEEYIRNTGNAISQLRIKAATAMREDAPFITIFYTGKPKINYAFTESYGTKDIETLKLLLVNAFPFYEELKIAARQALLEMDIQEARIKSYFEKHNVNEAQMLQTNKGQEPNLIKK